SQFGESLTTLFQNMPGAGNIPALKDLKGVMLKMETTSLKDNKTVTMVAKSVNKDGLTFKTDGYKGMTMPG
ncbi:MAG TPA: hypothetical protein PLQ32_10125, partial [Flavihumibacter sp.]|nr:hypothetical protein [Flavihumibacter sp.]